jgi:hypothetical protein
MPISILVLVRYKATLSYTMLELVYAYQLHSASTRAFYLSLEKYNTGLSQVDRGSRILVC